MEANASKARPLELEHPAKQNELAKALQTMVRHLPTPPLPPIPLSHATGRVTPHEPLPTPLSSLQPVCSIYPHLSQRSYFQVGQDQKKWVVMAEPVIRLTGR